MLDGTRVIDVHHHFLPRAVYDALKAEAGGGVRLVNDRISITLRDELCSVEAHLRTMDEATSTPPSSRTRASASWACRPAAR